LWRPFEAYASLRAAPVPAIVGAVALMVAAGFASVLLLFGEDFQERTREQLVLEYTAAGQTPEAADSMAVADVQSFRANRWVLGLFHHLYGAVYRLVFALIGGLATYGVVYAASWDWRRDLWLHLKAALLAMSGYAAVSLLLVVLYRLTGAVWLSGPSPSMLMPVPEAPSRAYVFAFLVLRQVDLQSAVTVCIWGVGLSSLFERSPSFGLKLVGFVYLCGVSLLAAPVLLSG
jgi:hypothetical protein